MSGKRLLSKNRRKAKASRHNKRHHPRPRPAPRPTPSPIDPHPVPVPVPVNLDVPVNPVDPIVPASNPVEPETKSEEARVTCGAMFTAKGRRYYQEDRGVVDDAAGFYAVFDGHGGDKASRFCAKHMAEYVAAEMAGAANGGAVEALSDEAVERAFVAAFIALDKKFQDKMVDDGSTACVARVMRTGAGVRLHVANAGDSRCIVVCADGTALAMSVDQKPHDPVERARIEAANHEVEVIDELVDG